MLLLLESSGAFFSILGAILMSLSTKEKQKPLYFAFISFFISTLSLLAFFLFEGKVPMLVQFCFFYVGAFLGVVKKSTNPKRDLNILSFITVFYFLILMVYLYQNTVSSINFEVLFLDSVASIMAIIGNFLLSSRYHIRRSYAFILFFFADLLYVYIGYSNHFYFFMIQSIFFLFTSSNGYRNTMKDEINEFVYNLKSQLLKNK